MTRRLIIGVSLATGIALLVYYSAYWLSTQPVWTYSNASIIEQKGIPATNKRIIDLMHTKGRALAPDYKEVVCTEFVIEVIGNVSPLTKREMDAVNIITSGALVSLVSAGEPVSRGVQHALVTSGKGIIVAEAEDVVPGDFVQFWNIFHDKAYGHCGVVYDVNPGRSLTVYSSHPITEGFGIQKFLWPDKVYFVRLK
jgi:hypothetical protein